MKQPKVLLCAPTSTYKDYIILEWYLHASTLTYQNYDIVICDNSHDVNYHKKLQAMGIKCFYVSPEGKRCHDYVCESQNLLRDYFLINNYDYFFSLEVDIFPPRNVIEKLLCAKKQAISAPYFYGFGKESKPIMYYFNKEIDGVYRRNEYVDLLSVLQITDANVHQVYATGIGCILFEREVMEKIKFRIDPKIEGFSDTPLYIDLYQNKIFNYTDTSLMCRHYNSDWFRNIDAQKNR
jgi:hypothetical protein